MKRINPIRPSPSRPASGRRLTPWFLLIIFIVGTGIRFYGLGAENLWLDEAISYYDSQRPLSKLFLANWFPGAKTHNGAFYFLLLRLVTLFSSSESALRLLSAFFGSLSILLLYYLAVLLFPDRRGLGIFAALLLALSPAHLHFSQSVRGYSLLVFLALASLVFQVRGLFFRRALDLAGFALCGILLYSTHFLSLLFIAGQGLVTLWYLFLRVRDRGRFLRRWSITYLFLLAGTWKAFLSLKRFFLVRAQLPAEDRWWLSQAGGSPGGPELADLFRVFALGFYPEANPLRFMFFLLPLLFLAAIFPRGGKHYFRSWEFSLGLSLFLFPVAVSFSFSQLENFFHPKYLIFTLPVFYLLAGRGMLLVPGRIIPGIILAVSLLAPGYALYRTHAVIENPAWKPVVNKIISTQEPYDVVGIHANYTHILFDYYTRDLPPQLRPPVYYFHSYSGKPEQSREERIRIRQELYQLSGKYRRMWLILSHTWDTDPLNLVEEEAASRYPATLKWTGSPRYYLLRLR